MLVQKWMLPSLNEILNGEQSPHNDNLKLSSSRLPTQAEFEWSAAVSATEEFLLQIRNNKGDRVSPQGVVFAGSSPLWSDAALLDSFPTWTFVTPQKAESLQLPPAQVTTGDRIATLQQIFLLNNDPLAQEQFCLVLTAKFSLLLVLSVDSNGNQAFRFSFAPEEAVKVWQLLRSRLLLTNSPLAIDKFDDLVAQFYPVEPDYRVVTDFSHLLLKHSQVKATPEEPLVTANSHRSDIELLQAFSTLR